MEHRSGNRRAHALRLLVVTCLLCLAPEGFADRPRLRAVRTRGRITLDGKLDEPAWRTALATDAFTQKFPNEGKPPSERTVLRVLYDDDALYVGFECEQKSVPIVRRLTRRDRDIEADWVSVGIDSLHSGTTAYEFLVNAAGVLTDGLRFDDTNYSREWDENWDARVAVTTRGWSAELRIPLRVLRFNAKRHLQEWGFQARRYLSARQETSEWSLIPRKAAGEVTHYGRLADLRGLRAGSPVEIRPFGLGGFRRRDASDDTVASGTDPKGSVGLDLKWHVTQRLTLDASLNPDFGQVEADQVVFNLTNVEIYLPEKRPFFLEGTDTFATTANLLYTRRIGRISPTPSLRDNERLVDLPEPASIYGATKLVGQVSRRLTLGILTAFVGENEVQVEDGEGKRSARVATPHTLHNVLRLKAAAGGNSHLGLMFTATNRFERAGAYALGGAAGTNPGAQLCPSGDESPANARCYHDAYVGGLDGRWRSPSGDYAVIGQAITTVMHQGPTRILADGTSLGSGVPGFGGYVGVYKEGGQPWLWGIFTGAFNRKLEFNDLGYMERQNIWGAEGYVEYRTLARTLGTLETRTRLDLYRWRNLADLPLVEGLNLGTTIKLESFWTLVAQVQYRNAWFDDRETGDGTTLQHEGNVGFQLKLTSDPRRLVSGELTAFFQQRFGGMGTYLSLMARLTLRVVPRLDLDLLPEAIYSFGEPRFIDEVGPSQYLFGRLLGRSAGATLRATYTFTPRLTLQVYTQLLVASRHYSSFSRLGVDPAGPRPVVHLRDLQPGPGPLENPDGVEGVLNVNVVLRWEYLLGSTLFLVYTRSQVPSVTLGPGQPGGLDLGALARGPAVDLFLVKLAYWWG